jgi:osmotically-inducible protein OsmY
MHNGWRTLFILSALCGSALLIGCNPQDAQNLTQDTRQLAEHTGQALGSASLAAKVNTVLSIRKGVDMSGLHVEAKGGVVTLGGHVRNAEERRRIVDTVEGIRGVDKVVDNLHIQP